jgi:hypothetical protein
MFRVTNGGIIMWVAQCVMDRVWRGFQNFRGNGRREPANGLIHSYVKLFLPQGNMRGISEAHTAQPRGPVRTRIQFDLFPYR